jgi:hypothetical protein
MNDCISNIIHKNSKNQDYEVILLNSLDVLRDFIAIQCDNNSNLMKNGMELMESGPFLAQNVEILLKVMKSYISKEILNKSLCLLIQFVSVHVYSMVSRCRVVVEGIDYWRDIFPGVFSVLYMTGSSLTINK